MSSKRTIGDQNTVIGKNINRKVVPFTKKHPDSAEAHFLKLIQAEKAKARIRGPIKSIELDFDEKPDSTEKKENNCVNCTAGIKYMRKVDLYVNGKKLNFGETGTMMGEDCFTITSGLCQALPDKSYKPRVIEPKEQRERVNKAAKAKIPLENLANKVVTKLREQGYDLSQRIRADLADGIQEQVMAGEFSGLQKELDPGRFLDIYDWALAQTNITDKRIIKTVSLLATNPESVRPTDMADLVLYEWQTRLWTTSGELGGLKEDIHYLATLSKNQPDSPVIKEYGRVDLEKKLDPIRVWDRATWEELTLRDAIGDTPEELKAKPKDEQNKGKPAISKAQARAVKYAVAGLRERRIFHNREIIRQYCPSLDEFAELLENVENRYNKEKADYAAAKKARIKEPAGSWSSTYKKLAPFFSLKEEVYKTRARPTNRQIILDYVFMKDADKTVRQLYVEGKKLDLATKLNKQDILGQKYSTLTEAKVDTQQLDKLLYSAIEFDSMPRAMKKRIRETGMSARTVKKMIEDVKDTYEAGLIPTKYIQPDGKKASMLERAVAITADFTADDGSTAKKIGYLRQLENELDVKIADVRADDGRTSRKKADAKFSAKAYEGKKYFSPAQKTAINSVYDMLNTEIRELDIPQAKKAVQEVEQFYEKHRVYSDIWFNKEKLFIHGASIRYKPFKECIQLSEEVQKFSKGNESKYARLNQRLRDRITGLKNHVPLPKNIDEVLAGTNILLTRKLANDIDARYKAIAERVIIEGTEKYQNPNMRYFDIVVIRRDIDDDREDHRIRSAYGPKRNDDKPLLKWADPKDGIRRFSNMTVEPHPRWGTWYGRGRQRDYVEKLCAKAEAERGVYLKIINARK